MGFTDSAKDAAGATGKKMGRTFDDAKEAASDKVDEMKADAEVKRQEGELKKAESEAEATKAKNEYKKDLRD
jgi:hypothetical protein